LNKPAVVFASLAVASCATLTTDAMTPVALSFSDGSSGTCNLYNKRGEWTAELPSTVSVRRSDDALTYQCTSNGRENIVGQIPSTVGAKIVASAVFIDLGITDAITDMHREYPASFVVPLAAIEGAGAASAPTDAAGAVDSIYTDLERLADLRDRGILTDAEFEAQKKKLLEQE
jgi:Short C-terminal domain